MKKHVVFTVLAVVALVLSACAQNNWAQPTAQPPVVQTQIVPQTVVIRETAVPPTAVPPTAVPPTATPVPTSAPASSMPAGWIQVEAKNTAGQTLSFNHDNDGDPKMVILTWGTVTASGTNLGDRALRVTWDPAGEKVSTDNGWGKYQWQGAAAPTKEQITELVNWRNAQLGGNYNVSWQSVVTAPYEPKRNAESSDWRQSREPKLTGDKILTVNVDLEPGEFAIAWFHAREGGQADPGPCTMFVMTRSGSVTYQGGLRFWKVATGGLFTKSQVHTQDIIWQGTLQTENRGTCPVYTKIYQDPSMQ